MQALLYYKYNDKSVLSGENLYLKIDLNMLDNKMTSCLDEVP